MTTGLFSGSASSAERFFARLVLAGCIVTSVAVLNSGPAIAAPPVAQSPRTLTTLIAALGVRTDAPQELAEAHARAERLRAQLANVEARDDWVNERLGYARDLLAEASTRSVSAEQQFAALEQQELVTSADLVQRVRAIEQSGGPMALYSQVWTGASITEVAGNLAALEAVLGDDAAAAASSLDEATQAAALQRRLVAVADDRARLVGRVSALAARAQDMLVRRQQLLEAASGDVQQLAAELAEQRARQEAAEAQDVLTAAGLVGVDQTAEPSSNGYGSAAVSSALSKLGSPYVWGAEGPTTFDCSGLVQWAYAQAGLVVPRLASDQYFASTPVAVSDMEPGDLLVYAYDPQDDNTIHHITMYIGNGQMVHAPHTGDVVRVVPVYLDGLYGVGRPG